mgnify:CR=1 FL=1
MKSLTLNSLIIVLFFASYVFAGGFEEDPGPEELVSESDNSTSRITNWLNNKCYRLSFFPVAHI